MFRIGVDVGGTFTDFAIWREQNDDYTQIGSRKLQSSRPDYAQAVTAGIEQLVAQYGVSTTDPVLIVHGTTISTNAVIERSEPPIALLTTVGYRDILGIARLRLDKPIDLFNRRTVPLVPRQRVYEIKERLRGDGSVDTPLDEDSVLLAAENARAAGATAIAVCLLHSYRNDMHERMAVALIRKRIPDLDVLASYEVWPQQSEYERAVVTLLNLYVRKLMSGYLGEIEAFLAERLPGARLCITKSNGGAMSAAEARAAPVHTLLSGPAAGVAAAQTLGGFLQLSDILTMDMGGTSTDVSLILGGRPIVAAQAQVGDFPLQLPVTAIEAMGAGGGSIAWLDGTVMKVGPASAGSRPGPACYGQGGTAPTLTDAYLLCNYLSPAGLLGGDLPLSRDLALRAFAQIAESDGLDSLAAAESCIAIATSNMLTRLLPFLARVGVNPTDLTLMIFGGAGGIHGPLLAEEIGIRRMIVPRLPSVFCAFGALTADLVHDAVRSVYGLAPDDSGLLAAFAELSTQGQDWIAAQVLPDQIQGVQHHCFAEMRYAAQSFTIPVDVTEAVAGKAERALFDRLFHAKHAQLFGHSDQAGAVVITELRVRTVGVQPKPKARAVPAHACSPGEPASHRDLRIGGRWLRDSPIYDRSRLVPGATLAGPAVIEQDVATILVPPGFVASVGELGDLWLERP